MRTAKTGEGGRLAIESLELRRSETVARLTITGLRKLIDRLTGPAVIVNVLWVEVNYLSVSLVRRK